MLHIKRSPGTEADIIANRRQRLIYDYRFQVQARLDARVTPTRLTSRMASRYFSALQRQFLPHYFTAVPGWRVRIRQLLKDRALPDFCIIGPAKAGTSDLAVTIMAHPDVIYPLVKEFPCTDPVSWRPFYPTERALQRRARRHGRALCALVSPYLHCHDIPITLSSLRPDIKIVINLRNPVDRLFSDWKWHLLHRPQHFIDRVPFLTTFPAYVEKAMDSFPEAAAPIGPALHYGIYANSVAQWLKYFGERNVRVFDIDDYFKDRNTYLERIETFLGLPVIKLPHKLPVANQNPLEGVATSPETSAKLRDFFNPYNRRLWAIIGATYPW